MKSSALRKFGAGPLYRESEYAVADDFCRIFGENMNSLYTLALWLTADQELAEECFLSALEDCRKANGIFKEWAESWSRLAVIESAIRRIKPAAGAAPDFMRPAPGQAPAGAAWVMRLSSFDRFVFVLAVLNRYSSHDCAIRLRSTFQDVEAARQRALQMAPAGFNPVLTQPDVLNGALQLQAAR